MTYVLWGLACVGAVVALGILIFAGFFINLLWASHRQRKKVQRRLEPVLAPLREGKPYDQAALTALADDAEFRNALFDALEELGKSELFPPEQRTLEAFAESVFVSWLAHPNELQKPPDELELISMHHVDSETDLGQFTYFLYRFKVKPPHFAADYGWMAGACGPFLEMPTPLLVTPTGLFSELEAFDTKTPEEHVAQVHKGAGRKDTVKDMREALAKKSA